jgi:hypothetical protein
MSNEQQQIIDEAYENYEKWWEPYVVPVDYDIDGIPYYSKEEFIDKCKTNPEFSEKWGLKIEERELSLEERETLLLEIDDTFRTSTTQEVKLVLDEYNIPTKLITITYNDKTITSYE